MDKRHKIFIALIHALWALNDEQMRTTAADAGIHWVTLYNWRSGKTFSPRFHNVAAVAEALGMELTLAQPRRRLKAA